MLIIIIVENAIFHIEGKWIMVKVQFGLIVALRTTNTGSIYTPMAYLAKMKMKKCLLKLQKMF